MRNVLITPDEVVFHAPTKHELDPRTIEQSIIIADERLVRPALGDDLYYALTDTKNVTVTNDNQSTLQAQIDTALPGNTYQLVIGDIVNALEFLSPDNQVLWKQHLWKLTAECVLLSAYPEGYVQFGSEGIVHMAPPASPLSQGNIISPDLRTTKWMMDKKMSDRIDPLIEAMHTWLCKRKTTYTLYTKPCDCDADGTPYKRKTDFILGIYDEDDGVPTDVNGCTNCYD
jgi:hypothetical protein